MEPLNTENAAKEKLSLIKEIRVSLWLGVLVIAVVAWIASYLSSNYLDRHISIVESICVMLPLWLLHIGSKIQRIRQLNRVLSTPQIKH